MGINKVACAVVGSALAEHCRTDVRPTWRKTA